MERNQQFSKMFDLREIVNVLFKYKRIIVGTCLVATVIASIIAFLNPRTYEARTRIIVKLGREFVSRPEAGTDRRDYAIPPETIINGEIQILKSKDVVGKAIAAVGLDKLYPNMPQKTTESFPEADFAAQQFTADLSVKAIPGTSLIETSFKHPNPNIALMAVNSLVDSFIEKHLEVFGGGRSSTFLKNQLQSYENRLSESENELESFKQKNNVFSLDEQKSSLLQQARDLDTNQKMILGQIRELEEKLAYVKSIKWKADVSPEVRTRLGTLQQKEHDVSERYTENSRFVQDARRELDSMKTVVQQNIEENRNLEISKLEREISSLRAKADSFKRQLGGVNGELQFYDAKAKELQRRKREVAMRENQFQIYANRAEESIILDNMDRQKMVNVAVLEPASIYLSTMKILRKEIIIPLGFLGGVACGIAIAFLLEFLSMVMTSPSVAEQRLGSPVLVAIRLTPENFSLPGARS